MLQAFLIDDEEHCIKTLRYDLHKYCPEVEIKACISNAEDALAALQKESPDLVFLDIEMPRLNGFQLLESLGDFSFDLIFTTAYDAFALNAFEVNAADYLLKPIDPEKLQKAVQKVIARRGQAVSEEQMQFIIQQIRNSHTSGPQRIALPSSNGLEFVSADSILYCEADGCYTNIFFDNGKKMLIARNLKMIEALVPPTNFLRVHHSYIANLNHITRFVRNDGGYLVMSNGAKVKVSRNRKDLLLERI